MPSTLLGVVVLLATFAPGYAWVRVAEGRRLRAPRSPLLETVELGLIGAVATLGAATVIAAAATVVPGFADMGRWAANGSKYFAAHPLPVLLTLAATTATSVAGAWVAATVLYRKHPKSFGPERSVWADVLATSGTRTKDGLTIVAFLAVTTKDGRIFEGYLRSFPTPASSKVDEIALQGPVFLRDPSEADRVEIANVEFLILMTAEITDVAVRFDRVKTES